MPIIASIDDLEKYINQVGECLVHPYPGWNDITSLLKGDDVHEREQRAFRWAEELHLAKKLFLSLAVEQQFTLTSWRKFVQVYPRRSNQILNLDEDGLFEVIRREGGESSRRLLQMSAMPTDRFGAAMLGLRGKMLVTLCGKVVDDDGQQMYCFDLTDNWLPDEYGI